ncbi:MAG: hypothetical protein IJX30_03190 [Clostridia bacterium]|nr:hypothetical protein [Clostridia bacterium]
MSKLDDYRKSRGNFAGSDLNKLNLYRQRRDDPDGYYATRVIASTVKGNEDYDTLRQTDWDDAIRRYGERTGEDLSGNAAGIRSAIDRNIKGYSPARTPNKWVEAARDDVKDMQLPGYENTKKGVTFDDYEAAYDRGVRGGDLTKLYNEALRNLQGQANEGYNSTRVRALDAYLADIRKNGYDENRSEEYKKRLLSSDAFSDEEAAGIVDYARKNNSMPFVDDDEYTQAKSTYELALDKVRQARRNYETTRDHHYKSDIEKAEDEAAEIYAGKIAPYELKGVSRRDIDKISADYAEFAQADGDDEARIMSDGLQRLYQRARTEGDVEADLEQATQQMRQAQDNVDEWYRVYQGHASDPHLPGVGVRYDDLEKYREQLASAQDAYKRFVEDNAEISAQKLSDKIDPDGNLPFDALYNYLSDEGQDKFVVMDALAQKVEDEQQADKVISFARDLKKGYSGNSAEDDVNRQRLDATILNLQNIKRDIPLRKYAGIFDNPDFEERANAGAAQAKAWGAEYDSAKESNAVPANRENLGEGTFIWDQNTPAADNNYYTGNMYDEYLRINHASKKLNNKWRDDHTLEYEQYLYDAVPDDVRNMYNYLWQSSPYEATEYFKKWKNTFQASAAITEEGVKEASAQAREHPVLASAISLVTESRRRKSSWAANLRNYMGLPIDPNGKAYYDANTVSAMRGAVRDDLSPVAGYIYDISMQALDSGIEMTGNAMLGGVLGGVANLSPKGVDTLSRWIGNVSMQSQVMQNAVLEGKRKGYSDEKAIGVGFARGLAEALSENFSIEKIQSATGSFWRKLAKSAAAEGTEEVESNWLNRAIDLIACQDESEILKLKNAKNWNEVFDVLFGMIGDDTLSFIGGGISGMAMSGVHMGVHYGDYSSVGGEIDGAELADLVSYAKNTKEFASMTKALKSDYAKGQLYYAVQGDLYDKLSASDVDGLQTQFDSVKSKDNMTVNRIAQQVYEAKLSKLGDSEIGKYIIKNNAQTALIYSGMQSTDQNIKAVALKASENRTEKNIGQLYRAMNKTSDMRSVVEDAARRSAELEGVDNVETVAEAAVKKFFGQKLSSGEGKAISSDTGKKVYARVLSESTAQYKETVDAKQAARRSVRASIVKDAAATVDGVKTSAIKFVDNGNVLMSDGRSVPLNAVQFDSDTDAQLWRIAAQNYAGSDSASQAFVHGYSQYTSERSGAVPVEDYARSFRQYYDLGKVRTPWDTATQAIGHADISNGAARLAYTAGFDEGSKQFKAPGAHYFFEQTAAQKRFLDENRAVLPALEQIAKECGVSFVYTDKMDDGVRGKFDSSDDVIFINVNANGGIVTITAGHELFHFIEKYNKKDADALRKAIIDKLKQTGKYETVYRQVSGAYRGSRADIDAEIAADSMFDVFHNVKELVDIIDRTNVSDGFWDKAFNELQRFVKAAKRVILNMHDADVSSLRGDVQFLDDVRAQFKNALAKAAKNKRGGVVDENIGEKFSKVLDKYDDKQVKDWENSKRIVLYSDNAQLYTFIETSLDEKTYNKKMYFGKVGQALAERISENAGIDVYGYNLSVSSDEIRKIFKDHGNSKTEGLRGQRAVVLDDFSVLSSVISDADRISLSDTPYNGKPAINFEKNINGFIAVVTVVSDKTNDLRVQTMYASNKKRSLATAVNVAENSAPSSLTSKTTRGTASIDNSIPQNAESVNTQYMQDSQNHVKESRSYGVDKKRKSSYNEFNTYAMQWANATNTRQGAEKCIYDPRTDEWCVIVADRNLDGGFGVTQYFRTYDDAENWLNRGYGDVESDGRERSYDSHRSIKGYGRDAVYSERDSSNDGYGEVAENEKVSDGESGGYAGRDRANGDQYRSGSGIKESRSYGVDKKRKSSYNEFNTYAMQWANATNTRQGAEKCIYDPRTDEWCVIVADRNLDGGFGVTQYFSTYDEAVGWKKEAHRSVESDRQARGDFRYENADNKERVGLYDRRDYGNDGYGEVAENEKVSDGEFGGYAGRDRANGDQYRSGSGIKESRSYGVDKKRKSSYNEFNTYAMQWANATNTRQGDRKCQYDPRTDEWCVIVADRNLDGGFGVTQYFRTYDEAKDWMREDLENVKSNGQAGGYDFDSGASRATSIGLYNRGDSGNDGYGEVAENERVSDGESGGYSVRDRADGNQDWSKRDIDESREVVKYYSREQARQFIRENNLDGLLDYVEKDTRLMRERVADRRFVGKLAKEVVSESKSSYDVGLLTDQLQTIYDGLLNDYITEDQFFVEAVSVLRAAYEQSGTFESEYAEGDAFVEKHAGETFAIQSLADTGYETFGELNAAFGGAERFVQAGGKSQHADNLLDKNWGFLVDDSGGALDLQTNEGDQVRALKELVDTVQDARRIEFSEYIGEDIQKYSEWRAVDLLSKFADMPEAKTYAQRVADKYQKQIAHMRQTFAAEKRELRESARTRYKDMQERNKTRKSLSRALTSMKRRYEKPAKSGYVVEAYRKAFEKVLELATTHVYRDYDMAKLNHLIDGVYVDIKDLDALGGNVAAWSKYALGVLEELKAHVNPDSDAFAYADKFKNGQYSGRGTTLGAVLSVKDLNALNEVVQGLKHMESNAQKIIVGDRVQSAADVSVGISEHLKSTRKERILENRFAPTSGLSGFMNLSFVTPVYFFDSLGDYGKAMFKSLSNAQANVYKDIDAGKQFIDGLMKDVDKKQFYAAHTVDLESGERVSLTVQQLMTLYLMNKRDAAKGRIRRINIERQGHGKGKVLKTKGVAVTENDLAAFARLLTDQQREVADKIQRFFTDVTARWGNEASMRMYGFEMFKDATYFPLATDPREHAAQGIESENPGFYAVANYGFTKQVNRQSLPTFRIENIFDVFSDHTMKMAMYHNMAPVLTELAAVYNYNKDGVNTKSILENYLSGNKRVNGATYMEKLMADLNNVKRYDNSADGLAQLGGKAKKSMVSANLGVALKQPTSYFRALNELSPEALTKGLACNPLKSLEEAKKYNGLAIRKSEYGGYTTGTSPAIRDTMLSSVMVGKEKAAYVADNALGFLAESADNITWGALWNACKKQIKIDNKGIDTTSDAYFKLVSDKFSEVINRTQVIDTPLNRSQIRRNRNPIIQTLAMFADESILTYNIARNAVLNGGSKWKRVKAAGIFLTSHVLSQAVVSMIDAFRATLRDKDKEEAFGGFWENYWNAFGGNFMVILNLPVYSAIVNQFEGFETKAEELEFINEMGTTVRVWGKILEDMNDDDEETVPNVERGLRSLANTLARLTGIPFQTWYKDIVGTVDTVRIGCGQLPLFEELAASRVRNALEKGYETKAKEYARELVKQKMKDDPEKSEKKAKAEVRQALYNAYNEKYIEAYENNNHSEMDKIRTQLCRLDIGYTPDTFSGWIKKYEEKKKQGR